MRKKRVITFLSIMLALLVPVCASATFQFFPANSPTDGNDALDMIDGDGATGPPSYEPLNTGDVGFVVTSGLDYCVYVMDNDSACGATSTESPCPQYVRPEDVNNAETDQCWVLADFNGQGYTSLPSATPGLWGMDSGAAGADKDVGNLQWNYIDGGDGGENADFWISVTQGGAEDTIIWHFDESDDQWETSKVINSTGGFTGALTGNVTGNCSGTAATVTGAAQSAITSVGTLTSLTSSGAIAGATVTGSATLAGNPSLTANQVTPGANGLIFEGTAADAYEGLLSFPVTTSDKTMTFQDVTGTVYSSGGTDIPVTDGGTGRSTGTTAYSLIATGTTATGAQQTLANGLTTQILVGGGASALPAWGTNIPTAVTIGSAYIYRAGGTDVPDADVVDALTISGGTVNNSVIGGSTPAAGTFTTATANTSVIAPLIDAAGDEDMDYGSADVDDHTFTSDGGTVVLDGSVTASAGVSGTTGTFSGELTGMLDINIDADGVANMAAADCRGALYYNTTQANNYELPPAAAGLNCCFYSSTAHQVDVEPEADQADNIIYEGTELAADEALQSPGAAGDFVCLVAVDANTWVVLGHSGEWTEETP